MQTWQWLLLLWLMPFFHLILGALIGLIQENDIHPAFEKKNLAFTTYEYFLYPIVIPLDLLVAIMLWFFGRITK